MADLIKLLVVEDDQLIQAMIEDALSDGGFESAVTASGKEAMSELLQKPDIAISGGPDRH